MWTSVHAATLSPASAAAAPTAASDAQNEDWFGFACSIDGTYIIAGAIGEDGSGSARGAAYLFKKI